MRLLGALPQRARIAIVGSGPAGMYCAQGLLKSSREIFVDVFEKLPVPFGLVRYGVAPDHADVKNCVVGMERMVKFAGDRFRFYGNVNIGKDVSVLDLSKLYDSVVLAYGAPEEQPLKSLDDNVPVNNCFSAKQIVGWYNGEPSCRLVKPELSSGETAVILGHGNVALDIARVLLRPLDELKKTDITEEAMECLAASRIRRVILVGRRGPLQVSFTTKELRELSRLPQVMAIVHKEDVQGVYSLLDSLSRPRQRLTQLLFDISKRQVTEVQRATWELRFLLSFKSLETDERKSVKRVVLSKNLLQSEKAVPTADTENMDCSLLIYSYGYRSVNIEPGVIPFNSAKHLPMTDYEGRVVGLPNVYACGWCRHGAWGVLLQTQTDAKALSAIIAKDFKDGKQHAGAEEPSIESLLLERKIRWLSWDQWKALDNVERIRGSRKRKSRLKITNIDEMLSLASAVPQY